MKSEQQKLLLTGWIIAFAGLAFVGTTILRVPIPATAGYFNLGDTFVMLAGLLFGPLVGAIAGAVGPAASDAIGFPQYVPATAIIKGCEGLIVGMIAGPPSRSDKRAIGALVVAIVIIVGGYFIFEAFIYPAVGAKFPFFNVTDYNAAIVEVVPNILQGVISAIIAYGAWRMFRGRSDSSQN